MRILLTLSFIFSLTFGFAHDSNPAELFEQANKLSAEGKLSEALSKYKSIEDMGLASSDLHFNMGTTYLFSNNISHAVLYLEKAHKADPSNTDLKHNLEIARSQIDSDIIEVPDFVLLRVWRGVSKLFSPLLWFILQVIFGLILIYGIYNWKLKDTSALKLRGFSMSIVALTLLIFCICAGFTADKMANKKDTAILMNSGDLKSGADDRSDTLTRLSEGVKLKINDQIGDWYKVQLINKEEGWVKKSEVDLI